MSIDKNILTKLDQHYVSCKLKYYKHMRAAEYYKKLYINTTIPIILFSTFTTILASFNGNFAERSFGIIVAVFSGLTTIGQALSSFLEYNVKYETHKNVSSKYMQLSNTIEKEAYAAFYENENDIIKYLFEKLKKELSVIQDMEPIIPDFIDKQSFREINELYTCLFVEEHNCKNEVKIEMESKESLEDSLRKKYTLD